MRQAGRLRDGKGRVTNVLDADLSTTPRGLRTLNRCIVLNYVQYDALHRNYQWKPYSSAHRIISPEVVAHRVS